LPKSMPAPTQDKIQNIFSCPSKKIKTPDTQTNPTKTVKPNNDNCLQARTTEHQLPTAVLRNGGFSGKLKCSFSNQHLWWVDSVVLRNPPLRKAANRYQKPVDDKKQRTEQTLNIPNPRTQPHILALSHFCNRDRQPH